MFRISNINPPAGGQISKWVRALTRPRVSYKPLVEVRVFKNAILHNLQTFKKTYPKFQFAPVLKSNAYGHGLVEVANILDNQDPPFFMVDSFYEALVLRRAGIKTKILVLGYATMEQINKNSLKNVSFAIIDLGQLKNIGQGLENKTFFHLKIDTGMHRQGILPKQLEEAVKIISNNKNIILEGVCSHFADADGEDQNFTKSQISVWNEIVKKLKQEFSSVKYFHTSNTAGSFYLPEINANVARLGIGLFGFNTSQFKKLELKPALQMASIITSIKTIPVGEKVGYNNTYTVEKETKVATIPVGYNEGLDVRLSNKGFVKVDNVFCPIVGRVSMNMCSVDVTGVDGVKLEDEAIIISNNISDKNSIENIIKICATSRYEIPIHIPASLRRVVI